MRPLVPLACLLCCALCCAWVGVARAQDTGSLQRSIDAKRAREARLGSQAARLGALERRVSRQAARLEERLQMLQSDLSAAQGRLDQTQVALRSEKSRAVRMRLRLQDGRRRLAAMLVDSYEVPPPDLITVVLQSRGFSELLERAAFEHRIQQRNSSVLDVVRAARIDAKTEARRLGRLERTRAREADGIRVRRDAAASIAQAVESRRAAVVQARQARLALRAATRASRLQASRTLSKLLAQQQRALDGPGPGGPWAIPWSIVQCESGGQNVPPNSAGASGYYQFLPSTWRRLGGSTPSAYQAPKAEQDRLAAQLWAGGRGARNWDCAAIVGFLAR